MTKDRNYELEEIIAEIKNSAGAPSDEDGLKSELKTSGKHLSEGAPSVRISKKSKELTKPVKEKPEKSQPKRLEKAPDRKKKKDPSLPSAEPDISPLFDDGETEDYEKKALSRKKDRHEDNPPYDFANKVYKDPGEALEVLSKKIVSTAFSTLLLFLFLLASLYLTLSAADYLPELSVISFAENPFLHIAVSLSLEVLSLLAAWEVTVSGLLRLFSGRPNMDTLVFFAVLCSVLYTLTELLNASFGASPVYSAVSVCLCFIALSSKRRRLVALKQLYKTIEIDPEPTALKAFGTRRAATAFKTSAAPFPEMESLAVPDKTEYFSLYYAPLMLVVSIALAAVSSFNTGSVYDFPKALCVITFMTVSPALLISSAFPSGLISRRLYSSGSALINRNTVKTLKKCRFAVVTDDDLFPSGTVAVTGLKIGDGFSLEYVYSVAASVLEAVGGGIHAAFENGARQIYAPRFPVSDVRFFESGGISAVINGKEVLCGSYSFLLRMGVRLKNDVKLSNCLFIAVDSAFAGVFSLKYSVQPSVFNAFRYLSRARTTPLLAVRDCNLTQDFVETVFKLKPYSTDYPSMEERAYLSGEGQTDAPTLALLTRSNLFSFAEVIIAGRKLKKTVFFNLVFSIISSVIGIGIMYFLASNGEYGAAAPLNVLVYYLCWLLPVWLVSSVFTSF